MSPGNQDNRDVDGQPKLNTTDYCGAAVSRCVSLPEIVIAIFEQSDRSECTKALLICKLWHAVGSDILWRHLDCLFPLLKLITPLSPLEEESHGGFWRYSEDLSTVDWERFHFYADRMHSIAFDAEKKELGTPHHLSHHLMRLITFYHPCNSPLLPNLRKIVWQGNSNSTAEIIIPLLSNNLKTAKLSFGNRLTVKTMCQIFGALSSRCRNLQSFSLDVPLPSTGSVSRSLARWISVCPTLQTIYPPNYYHTPEMIQALGGLDDLRVLQSTHDHFPPATDEGMEFKYGESSFPSLEELAFRAPVPRAIERIRQSQQAAQLQSIELATRSKTTHKHVRAFFAALAHSCPLLHTVELSLYPALSLRSSLYEEGRLPFDTIRPLLRCPRIECFTLTHGHPMVLTAEDASLLGNAWPKLSRLGLECQPHLDIIRGSDSSGNNISILYALAKNLPCLEELGLFFDERIPLEPLESPEAEVQFA